VGHPKHHSTRHRSTQTGKCMSGTSNLGNTMFGVRKHCILPPKLEIDRKTSLTPPGPIPGSHSDVRPRVTYRVWSAC
jgi:hypothetical protein